jgi:hypothetical protein
LGRNGTNKQLGLLTLQSPQLQQMRSPPARSLMTALIQVAKFNADAFVDGIILPSLHSELEGMFLMQCNDNDNDSDIRY